MFRLAIPLCLRRANGFCAGCGLNACKSAYSMSYGNLEPAKEKPTAVYGPTASSFVQVPGSHACRAFRQLKEISH